MADDTFKPMTADEIMALPPMSEQEEAFFEAMYQYRYGRYPSADELDRELVITPFDGNYGPAGLVIAINGSPPKAMMICVESNSGHWTFDAWDLRRRWQRIYESESYSNPRSGKRAKLAQAAVNLLESKGFKVRQ